MSIVDKIALDAIYEEFKANFIDDLLAQLRTNNKIMKD